MATIKILGDAFVLTSTIKLEDICNLKKFKPKALQLVDAETKKVDFAIGAGPETSFSKYGVVFASENDDGLATATFKFPCNGLNKESKEIYVKDNYGYALLNLNKLESTLSTVITETAAEFSQMGESIRYLD